MKQKYPPPTQERLLELSQKVVNAFFTYQTEDIAPLLDEQFFWIGGMSHQWSEGPEAFLRMKASEQHIQTLPDISEEYFTLLPGDEKTRIVCGRFVASVRLDTNFLCRFFIRVTMVWRKSGNDFKLLHLHSSNARDSLSSFESPQGTSSMCQYIREVYAKTAHSRQKSENSDSNQICLKDESGHFHYLNISEILYLKASNQWCYVVTVFGRFLTFGSLSGFEKQLPEFIRIHRSYLVNSQAVEQLRFHKVILLNQEELPVSKGRYTEVKALLHASS